MKRSIVFFGIFLSIISSGFAGSNSSAAGTIAKLTEIFTLLSTNGVIGTDDVTAQVNYFTDRVYNYSIDPDTVMTGGELWARQAVWNVVSKRLLNLKDQGFLPDDAYKARIQSYSGMISTGASLELGNMYKKFKADEDTIIYHGGGFDQDGLYKELSARIEKLYTEHKITKDKHATWLVKLNTQVYQYKSDAAFIRAGFDDEASNYTVVLTGSIVDPVQAIQVTQTGVTNIKRISVIRKKRNSDIQTSEKGMPNKMLSIKPDIVGGSQREVQISIINGDFKKSAPVTILTKFPNETKVQVTLMSKDGKELSKIQSVVKNGTITVSVNKSGTYKIEKI